MSHIWPGSLRRCRSEARPHGSHNFEWKGPCHPLKRRGGFEKGWWDANFLVATRRMAAVLAAIVSTAFSHRYAMRGSAQLPALSRARLQFDCSDQDSCELAYESFTQSLADGEFPTCLHTCGWRVCTPAGGAPAHLRMARLTLARSVCSCLASTGGRAV